ncbi:uncharacterized protein METZ01_LOCUS512791, partial [marine metagenome]
MERAANRIEFWLLMVVLGLATPALHAQFMGSGGGFGNNGGGGMQGGMGGMQGGMGGMGGMQG